MPNQDRKKKSQGENISHLKELKAKYTEKGRLIGLQEGQRFQDSTISQAVQNEHDRMEKAFTEREVERVEFYKERINRLKMQRTIADFLKDSSVENSLKYQQSSLIFAGIMGVFIGVYSSLCV